MSTTPIPASPEKPELPVLACPNCGSNLLTEGFYNSCSETTRLREDNDAYVVRDRLYIDHEESGHHTVDHQCDLETFCRTCNTRLPWTLPQIRDLNGEALSAAPAVIAKLMAELQEIPPDA